ncbi:MAG: capsular polysaccharide biosynthesis protein [Pseudomonadota bacterium]
MGGSGSTPLFAYNGGLLRGSAARRILERAGMPPRLGWPGADDRVAIWGDSPTAGRGRWVARRTGAQIVTIEDAFLRSVHPARVSGEAPLGLLVDRCGVHFDPRQPSDLETLLAIHPLDDAALLQRSEAALAWMRTSGISKYNGFDPAVEVDAEDYVLVIDQTRGDASVGASGADDRTFQEMLDCARREHLGCEVLIKGHPEAIAGKRQGHFEDAHTGGRVRWARRGASPWKLIEGARAIYTVSSQMGFEAILAGKRPHVFGAPFYAGWRLTRDRRIDPATLGRRGRGVSPAQLFAAAMILYPIWYDPHADKLCELEQVLALLEARARAWREDRGGWSALEMRLWKRRHFQAFFGHQMPVSFRAVSGRKTMVWASKADSVPKADVRVEDGFLRSRGLGAELVPPLSLVLDDQGIYYDPARPSRLDHLIASRAILSEAERARAERLRISLVDSQVTKYNLPERDPNLPQGHRILVPGQVEDDASVLLGGAGLRNAELIARVRRENPAAVIVYKPHPDVEAGLRPGRLLDAELEALGVAVAQNAGPVALIEACDEVWTLTSLLGFEALIRGMPVTCLGSPFYAGWGLTQDLGTPVAHRNAQVSLDGLLHAALIDYPRYFDPVTHCGCPVEVALERLASGTAPRRGIGMRSLSKLQGLFASYAHFWR